MKAEGDRRWQTFGRTLRQALIEHDLVGLRGIGRLPHADKGEGFAAWLEGELAQKVFAGGVWLRPYVRKAAQRAQRRADGLVPGGRIDPARIAAMESLATSELRGIVAAAQQQLVRLATQAMMASHSPTKMANALAGVIRTMRHRTRAMAEYVIARTHATSTLSAFRSAGVTHVGTIPERVRRRGLADAIQIEAEEVAAPAVRVPLQALISTAQKHWRERFATLSKRQGREKAYRQIEHELQQESERLVRAESEFAQGLKRGTAEYVARRQAEGEALRAAQQYKREDLYRQYAAMTRPGGQKPGATARAGRKETPSQETMARIEAAEKRLQATLGGNLVNIVTAGDDDVCDECQDISDEGPYSLDEAEGLIPAHPNCRCAFAPYRAKPKPKPEPEPEPEPEPLSVAGLVEHHGETSPEFKAKISDVVAALPISVRDKLREAGIKIAVGRRVTDIMPELKGITPRGWPEGTTWDNAEGLYHGGVKKAIVTEKYIDRYTNSEESTKRAEGVLRHEVGHGYDAALEWFSSTNEFKKAHDADAAMMDEATTTRLGYFLQSGLAGRQEAFAEVFGHINGGGASPWHHVADHFPHVTSLLRKTIGESR
jgi:hypothetical protein